MSRPDMAAGAALPLALAHDYLTSDTAFDVVYGSPYIGETDLSISQFVVQRELYAPGTSTPLLIENNEVLYDLITPSSQQPCPSNIVHVDAAPLALVTSVSVGGTPLTNDDQALDLDRSQPVRLDYTLSTGAVDYIVIQVHEVIAVGDNATQTATVTVSRYFASTETLLDPSVFVRNHRYIITATVEVGLPNAGQLDFRAATYPAGSTQMYTTMFRVAN
jgi:hypothetical protein